MFQKDAATGRDWIFTACEGEGSSLWWPSKDQWHDEVESMDITVALPSRLVDASNGRFVSKKDLGDGYTRWNWHVSYPINSYDVSINATDYAHFSDKLGDLTLDFYATPENLDKAKEQFAQAKPMIEAFEHYFGEYPFVKDGYKLIEVPVHGHGTSERGHVRQRLQERLWRPRLDARGHQPEVRLHHHSRERTRVVWQRRFGRRHVGHVDPGRLVHVPRGHVRRTDVRLRGRASST